MNELQKVVAAAGHNAPPDVLKKRQKSAVLINGLIKEMSVKGMELAKQLYEVKETFEESRHWKKWARENVNMKTDTIWRFTRAWERFGKDGSKAMQSQSVSLLDILARTTTPEEVRDAVVEKIERGEKVTIPDVTAAVREALDLQDDTPKLPTPKEAADIARETGTPQHARDGYIYFGATKQEGEAMTERRRVVYGMKDALKHISEVAEDMTPKEFLDYALPHQLWNMDDQHHIEEAADWVARLKEEWENR